MAVSFNLNGLHPNRFALNLLEIEPSFSGLFFVDGGVAAGVRFAKTKSFQEVMTLWSG